MLLLGCHAGRIRNPHLPEGLCSQEREEQWEQALTLLHKMRDTGMTTCMISYAAISACEKIRHSVEFKTSRDP